MADPIPGPPPAPTAAYVPDDQAIDVSYQDPTDTKDMALVAFAVELYLGGVVSGNRIAAGRKGVRQGRSLRFDEITRSGTYYARVGALNANNNGSDEATTTEIEWSPFSAGVLVGDGNPQIANPVTILGAGETYRFDSSIDIPGIAFQLVRGEGTMTAEGEYTAPADPADEVEAALVYQGAVVDTVVFRVTSSNFVVRALTTVLLSPAPRRGSSR